MKNEQEYLGKPEGKKPGPVMRCDKAYQEIRQIFKGRIIIIFFEESRPLLLQVSLLARIPLHKTREGAGCGSVGDVTGAWLASAPLSRRKAVRDRLALQGGTGDFP